MNIFKIGMLLGLSIITSIGAQNLLVIRQGIKKEYTYLTATICFLCDVVLIIFGVTGLGVLLIEWPLLKISLLILGICFLVFYGFCAIKRGCSSIAIKANLAELQMQTTETSPRNIILLGLSFSLFNPQALLDTLVIIGGTANQYTTSLKYIFVLGTICASLCWFFSLAFSAGFFSKFLTKAKFWVCLEFFSGGCMLFFAYKFLIQLI